MPSAGEFLDDLRLMQSSLAQHRGARMARGRLQRLITQVETFGFHLVCWWKWKMTAFALHHVMGGVKVACGADIPPPVGIGSIRICIRSRNSVN